MPIPDDPYLLDACRDVVIRFEGHGSYKGVQGAHKALARRAPGFRGNISLAEVGCLSPDRRG